MKQLTCEMCGSTDLIKRDGVFVCQSCGCKYSVEEAKKMIVEGTVEVVGTVKVDDTAKIDNYLELSDNAFSACNGQSAFDYANKALEIDPKNSKAWIAKMKAIEYMGTLGELKLMEVVEAGKNAVKYASDDHKNDITCEVYTYEVNRALDLLELAKTNMADTNDIRNTFKRFSSINILTAANETLNIDRNVVNLYDNIAEQALALVKLIPDDVLADYPEIAKKVRECAKQYQYETDALINRFLVYGAALNKSAKIIRANNKREIESKCDNVKKIFADRKAKEQAERNDKYWAEHKEQKEQLSHEKNNLSEQISSLNQSLSVLPEASALSEIERKISELIRQKKSLGLFKGKEKKALQQQIDNLMPSLFSARSAKDKSVAPIQAEIAKLQNRIEEIDAELTKDR